MRAWQRIHDVCVAVTEQLSKRPPGFYFAMDFGVNANGDRFAVKVEGIRESILRALSVPKEYLSGLRVEPDPHDATKLFIVLPRPVEYVEMRFELPDLVKKKEDKMMSILDEAQGLGNGE
jgi:hypothetical protein